MRLSLRNSPAGAPLPGAPFAIHEDWRTSPVLIASGSTHGTEMLTVQARGPRSADHGAPVLSIRNFQPVNFTPDTHKGHNPRHAEI
jgi:hypothetical protein